MSKHVLPHPPAISMFLEANRRKGLNDIPSPTTTNFRFKSGRFELDDDALSIECSLKINYTVVSGGVCTDCR